MTNDTPSQSQSSTRSTPSSEFDPNDRADYDQLRARAESIVEDEKNRTTITFEDLTNREVLTLLSCCAAGAEHYAAENSPEQASIAQSLHDRAAEQSAEVYEPVHSFFGAILARAMREGRIDEDGNVQRTRFERLHEILTHPIYSTVLVFSLVGLYIVSTFSEVLELGLVPGAVSSALAGVLIFTAVFYIGTRVGSANP